MNQQLRSSRSNNAQPLRLSHFRQSFMLRSVMLFRIKSFDELVIALFEVASPQLHAGGKGAIGNAQFVGQKQKLLQLLKLSKILIYLVDNARVQRTHLV